MAAERIPISIAPAPPGQEAEAVARALAGLGPHALRDALGDAPRVLVKPNLGWDLYLPGAVTSAAVLRGVVEALLADGREVVLIEADQVLVDIEVAARRAGVFDLCAHPRVSWVNLSRSPFQARHLPGARVLERIELPSILESAPLVTVPVMKTHGKTTISGALKNSWGLLPIDRYRHHPRVSDAIVDLYRLARPALCILDATTCLEGRGPKSGRPRRVDHVLACADGAALDWLCARWMGFDPSEIPHIMGALPSGFAGLGSLSLRGMLPDIPPFMPPGHNLISQVEGRVQGSALRRLIFDTPAFRLACGGARVWYHLWYHLGPGRALRRGDA